jgi:hypothetical protein
MDPKYHSKKYNFWSEINSVLCFDEYWLLSKGFIEEGGPMNATGSLSYDDEGTRSLVAG